MENKLLRLAISQPSNLVSSETTRETPLDLSKSFCFDAYFAHFKPEHIKSINTQFLEWFIGFSEGDGSFIVSNKRCYFIINQKDLKILYKIKKNLGFGKVLKYTQNNRCYGRYVIQDQHNCKRLAYIFNGNLVLNKTTIRFKHWIKVLNIKALKKKGSLRLDNAWLSGFIDAEGCFYAKIRKASDLKLNFKVEKNFIINQKGELPFFYVLKMLFKSNSKIQEKIKNNSTYYKLELSSMQSTQILLNYLEKFPCQGEKNITVSRYRRIYGYMERKEHLTKKGLEKIRRLCKKTSHHISYLKY